MSAQSHDESTPTFLFTDIAGSTQLWESHPASMRIALQRHDALLRETIERHGGHVFKTVGDAFCATFDTASAGLAAALEAQRALAVEPWPAPVRLTVRMALHLGVVERRDGDYFGPTVNRVARILATAHGGQTLLSQAVRDRVPPGTALKDLGTHQLKDLSSPERLFQPVAPDLPDAFPPLRSLSTHRNNLPQQMTRFIGRANELDQAATYLGKTRLLTVTGAGGSGKTRLALQVAAEVLERFDDGVFLVELAALTDPNLVPQTVANALGIQEDAGHSIAATLTQFLKTRRLLLLLDNCEHVLDASARLADDLLRVCPGLHILATSREALGIAGEVAYRIPSLADDEARHLFVDRAAHVLPGFTVTSENTPALAAICTRLDGIPLAIELAAARVRVLSVEEIDRKLDQRFHLLTNGSRTALPRQQTLRSLIDWSYALLSGAEKRMLESLSAFAGGWTLEATEAVCADAEIETWEALERLTSLVDKSLVLAETRAGRTRYRMLETIRQYARDRLLDRGDGEEVRARHRAYFLALAERAEPELTGPDQATWLRKLEVEHDNFRTALSWGEGEQESLRLTAALARFWYVRGHQLEAHGRFARALDNAPESLKHSVAYGRILHGAGIVANQFGDFDAGRQFHEQSVPLWQKLGNHEGLGYALTGLARSASGIGHLEESKTLLEEALAMHRRMENYQGITFTLTDLGRLLITMGQYPQARSYHEEALRLRRSRNDIHGIARSLANLSLVYLASKEYTAARRACEEAIALEEEIGDLPGLTGTYLNLGLVLFRTGADESARPHLCNAIKIAQEVGDIETIVLATELLASMLHQEGHSERAAHIFGAMAEARQRRRMASTVFEDEFVRPLSAQTHLQTDAAYSAVWEAGRALSLDEAVQLALDATRP